MNGLLDYLPWVEILCFSIAALSCWQANRLHKRANALWKKADLDSRQAQERLEEAKRINNQAFETINHAYVLMAEAKRKWELQRMN